MTSEQAETKIREIVEGHGAFCNEINEFLFENHNIEEIEWVIKQVNDTGGDRYMTGGAE